MHQGCATCNSKKCQSKPIACQLLFALWVETFKIQTAGGSVTSYYMQIPLSFLWRPYQCVSLCPVWSCVSGPCPGELAPCLDLAVLLSVNSVCACHPIVCSSWAEIIRSQVKYLHLDSISGWTQVEVPIPSVFQWRRGGRVYRMWLA